MEDKIPVDLKTIKPIYEELVPTYHRLRSLMGDIYCEKYPLSDIDESTILEFLSAATALKVIFEEYFDQATTAGVSSLHLSKREFTTVLSLAKTVELALRTPILNTGLWSH